MIDVLKRKLAKKVQNRLDRLKNKESLKKEESVTPKEKVREEKRKPPNVKKVHKKKGAKSGKLDKWITRSSADKNGQGKGLKQLAEKKGANVEEEKEGQVEKGSTEEEEEEEDFPFLYFTSVGQFAYL